MQGGNRAWNLIDSPAMSRKNSTLIAKTPRLAALLTALLLAASIQAQDLPDGPGKDLVTKVCTVCHETTRITSKKKTKAEWSDTVDKMAARGAMATDEEFEMIVAYLAKNFGTGQSLQKSK